MKDDKHLSHTARVLAAHQDLREAMVRAGNAPLGLQQAEAISQTLILLRRTMPDLAQSEAFAGLYSIAEEFLSRHPVDLFGGNDTHVTPEFRNIMFSAAAHALSERAGIPITHARQRVAKWSGNVVTRETLRRWGRDGEQLNDARARMWRDSFEGAADVLAQAPDDRVETIVRDNVTRVARNFRSRPRLKR